MAAANGERIRGRRVWLRALEEADLPAYKRAINSVEVGSWAHARDQGKLRTEGKEYIFQDGDVTVFLTSA